GTAVVRRGRVHAMVSGAGRHHPESDPAHLCQLPTAVVPGAAGGGSRVRLRQDGGDVLRPAASGAGVVDVHAPGGGRGDQQRGGARLPACGAVAAEQPRDGERGGESVRGTDPDGGGHLSATRSPRVGLSDGVLPSVPAWRSPSVAPTVVTTRKRTLQISSKRARTLAASVFLSWASRLADSPWSDQPLSGQRRRSSRYTASASAC